VNYECYIKNICFELSKDKNFKTIFHLIVPKTLEKVCLHAWWTWEVPNFHQIARKLSTFLEFIFFFLNYCLIFF
jgi:hypothetical protein